MSGAGKLSLSPGWAKTLKDAIELDSWGQREEARSSYERLARSMVDEMADAMSESWTKKEAKNVQNLAICLRLRAAEIKQPSDGVTLANMKALIPVAENLFKSDKKFPLDLTSVPEESLAKAMADMVIRERAQQSDGVALVEEEDGDEVSESFHGNARLAGGSFAAAAGSFSSSPALSKLNSPSKTDNRRNVFITVDKIGFKNSKLIESFVDPIITIYIVSCGKTVGAQQDTSISSCRHDNHLFWEGVGARVTLPLAIENILPGSAVIFEFRHYKREKKKISVKCWGFIDREDIKDGRHVLELYKKPTDLRRKNLSLMSIKPLYLHVEMEVQAREAKG